MILQSIHMYSVWYIPLVCWWRQLTLLLGKKKCKQKMNKYCFIYISIGGVRDKVTVLNSKCQ